MRSPAGKPDGTALIAGRESETVFRAFDVNHQIVLLASQADTTATRNSDDQISASSRAIQILVKTANKVGTTAEYTPSLQRKNADGTYATIWTAAAALTGNGSVLYELGDFGSVTGASGVTERVALALPQNWRVVLTAASADGSHNMDTYVEADLVV